MRVLRAATATFAAAALVMTMTATSASAQSEDDTEELGTPTEAMLADSVREFSGGIRTFEPAVTSLETVVTEDEETTITLSADILFAPDKWDLTGAATARIEALIADIPEGAQVSVHGHTDSVNGAVENQLLSENRAGVVADVIAGARPDLQLEEAGFANTRPAVTEVEDDPSTRAANRRVEITYSN